MADRVGQQLGNYRLLRLLGEGGFAEVYLSEHVYLGSQAAIKLLHTRLGKEELEGFLSEARTIAGLKHPHIVRVLDFGVEGSTPFLVMDYAPGGTLRERTPKGTQLPLASILPAVRQVADALQYAHDQRLIHRDIKPENMLLDERGQVVLSDFGIATIAQSSNYQQTGGVAGTAAYMAPEQLQGKPRPASDQYALGIVVYEWLTGARPFQGSLVEVASQHVLTPPPPLRDKVPTLSPDVEEVVLTALAKDPRERFASVQAFATALEQASGIAPPLARPSAPIAPTLQPATPSGLVQSTSQPPASWQFAPTQLTPPQPAEQPTPLPTLSSPAPPPAPAGPSAAQPTLPVLTQTQPTTQEAPLPPFGGTTSGPVAPPAPAPITPRAKQRWVTGLLVGLLALVVVSGGLVGLGALAGKGPFASAGRSPSATLPTVTRIPRQPLGTLREFALPNAQSSPGGITAGPDGNLWFTQASGNRIGRITQGGSITEFALPTPDSNPGGITIGPDGNLWFTEQGMDQGGGIVIGGNKIGRITPSGTITEFALPTSKSGPAGITAGPDGNLWFTEQGIYQGAGVFIGGNKIGRITPAGQITEFALPTTQSLPYGITAGPDGNLWFTEEGRYRNGISLGGNQIGRITPEGSITEFALLTTLSYPIDITAGPDGNLWFAEFGSNQIGRLTPEGSITEFVVPPANSYPIGITAGPDSNLWFTESYGNQIGRLTPGGTVTEFALPTTNSIPDGIAPGPDGNLWFTEQGANQIGWISPGP